ncbi:MAG: hypothetical protein GY731_01805 [Gammaproteobacteria bacterium]|nr:hypothetical protein [Gammaproteobacteria bacterium]
MNDAVPAGGEGRYSSLAETVPGARSRTLPRFFLARLVECWRKSLNKTRKPLLLLRFSGLLLLRPAARALLVSLIQEPPRSLYLATARMHPVRAHG